MAEEKRFPIGPGPEEEKDKKKKKKKKIILREGEPPRDPNREPSTKIFDIIGDVLKTPYKIRGGNAKGGRIGLKGGGICKKGMNKKARGANS